MELKIIKFRQVTFKNKFWRTCSRRYNNYIETIDCVGREEYDDRNSLWIQAIKR